MGNYCEKSDFSPCKVDNWELGWAMGKLDELDDFKSIKANIKISLTPHPSGSVDSDLVRNICSRNINLLTKFNSKKLNCFVFQSGLSSLLTKELIVFT